MFVFSLEVFFYCVVYSNKRVECLNSRRCVLKLDIYKGGLNTNLNTFIPAASTKTILLFRYLIKRRLPLTCAFHFRPAHSIMSRIICSTFFLVVVSGFERVALSSLRNRSAAGELIFPAKEVGHPGFEVPAFVMGLYRTYAKDDGPAKRKAQRIPATVHSIVGQGNVGSILL